MDVDKFDIVYPSHHGLRGAFRASLPGLTVRFANGNEFEVRDLSSGGLGFVCPNGVPPELSLVPGESLTLTLCVGGKPYVSHLLGRVVRISPDGVVAMAYPGLERDQERRLDKLILEIQKRIIAKRKAEDAALKAAEKKPVENTGEPITI